MCSSYRHECVPCTRNGFVALKPYQFSLIAMSCADRCLSSVQADPSGYGLAAPHPPLNLPLYQVL